MAVCEFFTDTFYEKIQCDLVRQNQIFMTSFKVLGSATRADFEASISECLTMPLWIANWQKRKHQVLKKNWFQFLFRKDGFSKFRIFSAGPFC